MPFTLDVFLPFSQVPAFLAWYRREVGHFPLWCVPYRRVRDYEWIADDFRRRSVDDLWIDLAIYGLYAPEGLHARIEEKLFELGGLKTLISRNHYSEERFWQIWNRDTYRAVKARTDPDNVFRDLYTKDVQDRDGHPRLMHCPARQSGAGAGPRRACGSRSDSTR